MSAVLRDITEIEVFLSPGFRGLNARIKRARIWRLNMELARTESGIYECNYLQVYEEHIRECRILAVPTPANICYVLVSRTRSRAIEQHGNVVSG